MKTFIEYDDAKPCPCGSQKTYNTCCKLKSIRWGFDESGALVKQLPMSLETEEKLKATNHLFEQYYGRKPDKEDYVFSFTPQIAITSWTPRGKNLGHGWSRRIYP